MSAKEDKPSEAELKMAYLDILNGYSRIETDDIVGYIKHLTIYDSIDTDAVYQKSLDKAKGMGLPTKKEQIEYLNGEGLWSRENELEMSRLRSYLQNLEVTKRKLFLDSEIQDIRKSIEENQKKLQDLAFQRKQLLGFVAEAYAEKVSNEHYVHQIFYKDQECKVLYYSEEEFNDLTDLDLNSIYMSYSNGSRVLKHGNIKRIAISGFFTSYFYLCDDNIFNFYGKPIIKLTQNQNELYTYGRYFKNLAQDAKVEAPVEIRNDPDALIEFYEGSKNAEEAMDKMNKGKGAQGQGASTIVGATKKDLEKLGYKETSGQTIDLVKEAEKRGGTLSMDDFIEIHHD